MNRIEQLLHLLDTQKNDCFLLHALGLEYMKLGNYIQSKIYFETVLHNDPNYVGTYYHLGKLLEQIDEPSEAKKIYEAGMLIAQRLKDQHSYNELQMAKDELD